MARKRLGGAEKVRLKNRKALEVEAANFFFIRHLWQLVKRDIALMISYYWML